MSDSEKAVRLETMVSRLDALLEVSEKRLALLEQDVREHRHNMRVEFRVSYGVMIAGFWGLAGIMARGFGWL